MATSVSQFGMQVAYSNVAPDVLSAPAWFAELDGHRFYILPLGVEGDWAFDLTTGEWSQLQTLGFYGLNLGRGVMWGLRIIGGDLLNGVLYEMDPTQALDEGWRPIQRIVTGGLSVRSTTTVAVANFTLAAYSVVPLTTAVAVSLDFSDDDGRSWVTTEDLTLTGDGNQLLIWSALGSFSAPGRIFRVSDMGGLVRIDGADAALDNFDEDDGASK